jgi:Flp pilus assembly protein TadG
MSLCSKAATYRWRKLMRDAGGNVGIIFAFALLPIILATGAALDYGHYNAARARIQMALDATGLMLAHNVGTMPTDDLLDLADEFFDENFPSEPGVHVSELTTVVNGDKILLAANAKVDTYIMHLAGVQFLAANVDTEITKAEDSYEVVLVLDNTGSMSGSKIESLKDAAGRLVNNLFGESATHPLLKMGLVPFSHAVNVGTGNANASWMDTQALNPIHKELFDEEFVNQGLTRFDLYDRISNVSWPGCVEARVHPLDVNDTAPTSGNPDSLFVPYFAPDEPGDARDPERHYSNSYLDDVLDDIDRRASNEDRQKYTLKYANGVRARGGSPGSGCTARPILPLTNQKSNVTTALEGMRANGYTNITEGLMWGLRVISPGEPFTEGKPYGTDDHHKIIILLTDGMNQVPSTSRYNPNKSAYGPYGYMASGRLVNSSNTNTIQNKMDERTGEACEAVKAQDIELFTITFELNDTDTQNLMRNCASQPDMYYNSPSTSTLNSVFQAIATRISELRISK